MSYRHIKPSQEDPKGEATITYVTAKLMVERNVESNGAGAVPNLELDGEVRSWVYANYRRWLRGLTDLLY
jgi:hypothetical protein